MLAIFLPLIVKLLVMKLKEPDTDSKVISILVELEEAIVKRIIFIKN